jgi:hypothetical protein
MLSFICDPCKEAGNVKEEHSLLRKMAKENLHMQCKGGTWCFCQHRVGRKNV